METLSWEQHDGIGLLTFQRPQALNAINLQMMDELLTWLEKVKTDKTLRTVILTGSGKAFIAGADIKELASLNVTAAKDFSRRGHQVLLGIQSLRVPVIAAVNGFALGGGCEMAMACDFILASEQASFGLPEVTLGLIPGFGGTQRLPRFVGVARAAEMIFTGKRYSAQEALQFGLVNTIFPSVDLITGAKKIALEISTRGPVAVAEAKKVLASSLHLSLEDGLKVEEVAFSELFLTGDQKEGTRAFIEKRPAQFRGN